MVHVAKNEKVPQSTEGWASQCWVVLCLERKLSQKAALPQRGIRALQRPTSVLPRGQQPTQITVNIPVTIVLIGRCWGVGVGVVGKLSP